MVAKMRVGILATPVVSALYANSPLSGGRENGFVSKRLMIWRDTDPDRCGQIPFVFDPEFGYERYAQWALDVPLFFVVRGKHYEPGDGTTFRQFLDKGFRGLRPTLGDWETHLTTLFPDVRLKRLDTQRARCSAAGWQQRTTWRVCSLSVWKSSKRVSRREVVFSMAHKRLNPTLWMPLPSAWKEPI